VLEAVSYKLADLLQADRATIFLVDRDAGMMRSRIAHSSEDNPLGDRKSRLKRALPGRW